MKTKQKINVVDLFAGCGGLTDGFEYVGNYDTIASVEWDKPCCETLKKRLKNKWGYGKANESVLNFDIQRTEELLNGWNDEKYGTNAGLKKIIGKNKVDLIVGGPPCQAYSIAGRIRDKNGMKNDYRNYLFESYLKIVDFFKPKFFVFENVPGIFSASPDGKPIIDKIILAFEKIGYAVSSDLRQKAVLDSSEFGVPQVRKRVIILGVNKKIYKKNHEKIIKDFYSEILPKFKIKKKKTVKEAISDLPQLYPLDVNFNISKKISHIQKGERKFLNHTPRFHSKRDMEIFKELAVDIKSGRLKYASAESLKELYFKKTGKRSNVHKYNVLRLDKPSNTIPAHLYKDGLRHIHPDPVQARSITVREAARLQSFDDDFEFLGSIGDQYKMIGNAVPPKLSFVVAKAIHEIFNNY